MATLKQIEEGIVKLDSLLEGEQDPEKRQEYLDDIATLAKARGELKTPEKTETDPVVEDLREKKGDLAGFASALASGVNRGAVSIANLPFDIINLALSAFGAPESIRTATPSQAVDFLSEQLTGYRPVEMATTPTSAVDTPAERMLGTVAEYASGGYTGAKLAKEVAERAIQRQSSKVTGEVKSKTPLAGDYRGSIPVAPRASPTSPLTQAVTSPGFVTSETVASTAAGLAAAPAREYTESPLVETGVALLGGITPTVAASGARAFKTSVVDQFTRTGAELRVANELTENVVDAEQALDNITNNILVLESAVPEAGFIDPARLTEDPGILKMIGQVADNDPVIFSIIERQSDKVTEQVFEELQAAAAAGDPQRFLDVLNGRTNDVLTRIESDIDLAQNQISKIEAELPPDSRGSDISQRFVQALERSYERAKEYERGLWSLVDKKVPMDGKRFRLMGIRLRNQLKRKGFSDSDLSFFMEELPSFGVKNGINTFEGLQRFRSRLLQQQRDARAAGNNTRADALRRLDELSISFIDSGPNAETYRAAAETTRLIRQSYNRGKLGQYLNFDSQEALRIDPEAALDKVIRTGRNIGEVRRAITAEQPFVNQRGEVVPIPPARGLTDQIQEMLWLKFSEAETPAARKTFFKQYGETLQEFPELSRDLNLINREIETLSEVIARSEGRAKTATDKDLVSVAALIGADPENIIKSFKNLSRKQIQDVFAVASQEGVEGGMQSVFLQEIVSKMTSGEGDKLSSLGGILSSSGNRHLQVAFNDVLTPAQRKALSELEKTRKLLAQNLGKTGSNEWFTRASPLTKLLARMSGVRVASMVAPSGPGSLQAAAVVSSLFSKVMDRLPSQQTRRVLIEALQDPKYFEQLLKLEKSNAALPQQMGELQLLLRKAGIRIPVQAERIIEEERRKQKDEER